MQRASSSLPAIAPAATFARRQLVEHGVGPYVQRIPGAAPLPADMDSATLARVAAPLTREAAARQRMMTNVYLAVTGAAAGLIFFALGVAQGMF